jgi:ribosomal peptide maturation radical SAM protein 1
LSASERPRLLFETARGCWWGERQHCTFCGLNGTAMAFRSKSAARALDELLELTRAHPAVPVMVIDRILDLRYFQDFLPAVAQHGLGVKLFYEVKANLSRQQLRQLKAAGVTEILPGVESFSDPILRLMRKGLTGLQNIQLLKWSAELGIWPVWYLIWGFPGEPQAEYRRMAGLLPLLSHLPPPDSAVPIELVRYSPNFEDSQRFGIEEVAPRPAYRFIYPFPDQALRNLAWYFTFRHRDGRKVGEYTQELAERVIEWHQDYPTSQLIQLDRGEESWIYDLRPVAQQPLIVLDGLESWIYRACDQIRTLGWLAEHAPEKLAARATSAAVEARLGPLLESGLIVRDGDRLLSLALRGDETAAQAAETAVALAAPPG